MAEWPSDLDRGWQRSHADREGAYEDQAVKFALRRLQLGDIVPGRQKTFDAFHDALPTFPLRLFACVFPHMAGDTQLRLFKELAKPLIPAKNLLTSLLQRCADDHDISLDEQHVGVVFAWPAVSRFCVCHTLLHGEDADWHQSRLWRRGGHGAPIYLRLERFEQLLTGVAVTL